jgi:glycosyltransferase involved in cell wall biosynthesis
MSGTDGSICLVGHPFMPIGMGEHVRSTLRAMRHAALEPRLVDVYGLVAPGSSELAEFSDAMTKGPSEINVFHINGNEVEQALTHLEYHRPWSGYNIIYPLWELGRYPAEWAAQLDRFDEIWAPSRFIHDSLHEACRKPVVHMTLACEVLLTSFLGRRYFGIPEADYAFLFFYDLRSYSTRKNPQAVVSAFRRILASRPYLKSHLVIKVNGIESNPSEFEILKQEVQTLGEHVTLLKHVMTHNEIKNLVRCCDCFVSLHRSEGYGFGIAEAMVLGKPVIATAYSGNMDFMGADVSYGVAYDLVAVNDGEYPHHEGQVWAEPDWRQASTFMEDLIENPSRGRAIGELASRHMRSMHGYRATGLRYLERLERIQGSTRGSAI